MPWLPFYALDSDIDLLNDWLCRDKEVYFIKQVDRNHWTLVKESKLQRQGYSNDYRLWHLPSGQVPIITERNPSDGISLESIFRKKNYTHVSNPFEPWPGRSSRNNPGLPFFEDDETKVFNLTINYPSSPEYKIPISSFGWLENRYSILGKGADEVTKKWWNRLRYFIKRNTIQIPLGNDSSNKRKIHAFPVAWKIIKSGRGCGEY